ncbi:MAG: class I SAM-dependent methyltransferase [Candidatus Omnitrophota bacterium]
MSSGLVQVLNIIQESRRYNKWIYSLLQPYLSGVILDIGSGLGDIASLFVQPQVKEVIFSDGDKSLVAGLKQQQFSLRKYRVVTLDISQDEAITQFKGERVDTISCVNVLEHIKDDLGALRHMQEMLKPQGRLVVLVPALPCLYGSLDACHGHQRRYTQKALKAKMRSAGFYIEAWRYVNFFGVFTWFLAGRVLKQRKFSKKTCYQLDKIVPLLRWIERGFRLPWGQSLMMVGRISSEV